MNEHLTELDTIALQAGLGGAVGRFGRAAPGTRRRLTGRARPRPVRAFLRDLIAV